MKHYGPSLPKEVCWDMRIAESANGVRLQKHKPVRKAPILTCDMPWEGSGCCYAKIFYDGEKYRFYYRGQNRGGDVHHSVWCVAYSYDGKNFIRPDLGIFEFEGSKHNNIIMQIDNHCIDNFSITFDENPNCPPDEKYKAFTGIYEENIRYLHYYTSGDGIHFREVAPLAASGNFDSLNICFWDERKECYSLYLRGLHDADPAHKIPYENEGHVRDVRVSYSHTMEDWTDPVPLDFGEDDKDEIQLYTNGVMKYPNTDMYIGIPTRYIDRAQDRHNFKYLSDLGGFRTQVLGGEHELRLATAVTEAMLMTSRDGLHFERTKEAFYTPGIENADNWVYGDGYFAVGMVETASDFEGEPNELSLYVGTYPFYRCATFSRYTLRMDGFFSWHADFAGGDITTKPFTFEGSSMLLNFATSALGYLRIEILDEDGNAIEGYDTGRLFGNAVARPCDFEKPLSALAGKPIRLRVSMRDADLYAFRFV